MGPTLRACYILPHADSCRLRTPRRLYRTLYGIRRFEQTCIILYRQGHIRGYLHPYLGEEAIATGICAEITGKATGYCGGLGGSMHIADSDSGNLGANGIVGAGIPIGVGAALGATIRGEDRVCVVFSSDGAANHGTFGEALNLAAIWNLPLLLVVENNQFAVSTPVHKASRVVDLFRRGQGYGVESLTIDGNDVLEVYECATDARRRLLGGEGPILIEAKTYRQAGHHVNDPGDYMPPDQVEHYKQRDPLTLCRRHLADDARADAIETEVDAAIEAAVDFAHDSPEPAVDEFLREYET